MQKAVVVLGGRFLENLEKWMNIGRTFEEMLRPQTYPLAVKLISDESEFPEKTRRPEQK